MFREDIWGMLYGSLKKPPVSWVGVLSERSEYA